MIFVHWKTNLNKEKRRAKLQSSFLIELSFQQLMRKKKENTEEAEA